jgi:hypothetical protein
LAGDSVGLRRSDGEFQIARLGHQTLGQDDRIRDTGGLRRVQTRLQRNWHICDHVSEDLARNCNDLATMRNHGSETLVRCCHRRRQDGQQTAARMVEPAVPSEILRTITLHAKQVLRFS